jgi:hypothetical protein
MLAVKVEHLEDSGQVLPCHHEYKRGYLSDFLIVNISSTSFFWP